MKEVVLYLTGIIVANVAVHIFGIVTIFGLTFPAGAIFVGLTFSFRDMLQKKHGPYIVFFYMIVAIFITAIFNQRLALASCTAFAVSEIIDQIIYTISKGSFKKRLIISNLISIPIDSIIFITIAFGINWNAIIGQSLIKIISSLTVLFCKK